MAIGINYSKWDTISVSNSEDEEDDDSKATLLQRHRDLEEVAESQKKLRTLIDEHQSGKPLEPPEEIRDILAEPFWCDEPGDIDAEVQKLRQSDHLNGSEQQPVEQAKTDTCKCIQTLPKDVVSAGRSSSAAANRGKRRDFADWDKLKLDDTDDEGEEGKESQKPPPAEVEKLRQLMQLQEGLNKMRKDREERQRQIQLREQRILEREQR
jgi:hypothetical protein